MGRHSIPDPDDTAGEPSEPPFDPRRYGQPHGFHEPRDDDLQDAGYPEDSDYPDEAAYPGERRHPDERGDPHRHDYSDQHDYPDEHDYADEPEPPGAPPPPSVGLRGGHRDDGEWRGGHRSEGGRRGVSIGVIVALVAVVVLVAGVILWRFFGDVLSNRSGAAASRCVGGNEAVAVIADPSISGQLQQFADRYNKVAGPIGDRCVKVNVKAADSEDVINGFIGNWPDNLGDRPALWIPASSVSTARLQAAAGAKTISDSRSLVSSPVLLAIRPQLKAG